MFLTSVWNICVCNQLSLSFYQCDSLVSGPLLISLIDIILFDMPWHQLWFLPGEQVCKKEPHFWWCKWYHCAVVAFFQMLILVLVVYAFYAFCNGSRQGDYKVHNTFYIVCEDVEHRPLVRGCSSISHHGMSQQYDLLFWGLLHVSLYTAGTKHMGTIHSSNFFLPDT